MSILTLPRVSFFGKTEWNPDTTNNYDANYNANTAQPVPADAERQTYLDNIKQQVVSQGSWNLYGDHATTFVDTKINSILLTGGAAAADPLLGRSVQLLGLLWSDGANPPGRLVDVDPYGSISSQIFFDSFQIGDDQVGVVGKRVDRFSDRDFYFARNLNLDGKVMIAGGMGVAWQTSFPKAQLTWTGLDKSPALTALKAAVDANSAVGLVVRFVSYRTQYLTNCSFNGQPITTFQQLQQAYEQGFKGSNPAYSVLLGNVGVWKSGTLATGPSNRVLVPVGEVPLQGATPAPAAASAALPAAEFGSKTLRQRQAKLRRPRAVAEAASGPPPVALGPTQFIVEAGANADAGTVVFDFMNTVPEINQELVKANLGSFQVQVRDLTDNTKVTPLGAPIDYAAYDRDTYQAKGGVLSVPFASGGNALQNGKLEVVSVSDPQADPLLVERRWEVATDAKSLYLDEGQTLAVQIAVQDRGAAAANADLVVSIAQYLGGNNGGDDLVTNPGDSPFKLTDTNGTALPVNSNNVATIAVKNGVASFQVSPAKACMGALCYIAHLKSEPPTFEAALDVSESFSNLRNLPWDQDLAQYDKSGVTIPWKVVYENILRVYDLVYPVMSLVIDLQNKQAVDGAFVQFRAATAQDIFESGLFMPITRELSQRKRNILWRYLQQVEMGGGSSPS